jgi:hypothetical protein
VDSQVNIQSINHMGHTWQLSFRFKDKVDSQVNIQSIVQPHAAHVAIIIQLQGQGGFTGKDVTHFFNLLMLTGTSNNTSSRQNQVFTIPRDHVDSEVKSSPIPDVHLAITLAI